LFECGVTTLNKNKIIYAANHYRAIADMVYDNVKRGHSIKDTISLTDWLPELHEKKKIYELVDRFHTDMTSEEWRKIEEWKELTIIWDSIIMNHKVFKKMPIPGPFIRRNIKSGYSRYVIIWGCV
jgi:hypothetical protein